MDTPAAGIRPRTIAFAALSCIIAALLLLCGRMAGGIGAPFEVDYHPHPLLELLLLYCGVHLLAVLYLVFLPDRSPTWFRRGVRRGTIIVLMIGTVGYLAYHAAHPGARVVMGFDGPERVTPYHIQLARVFFDTLLGGSILLPLTDARLRWPMLAGAAGNLAMSLLVT